MSFEALIEVTKRFREEEGIAAMAPPTKSIPAEQALKKKIAFLEAELSDAIKTRTELLRHYDPEGFAKINAENVELKKRINYLNSLINQLQEQKAFMLETNVIFRNKIQTQVMPAMKATEFRLKLALEENEILKKKIKILEENQISTLIIDEAS